jgi:hypothetical protein
MGWLKQISSRRRLYNELAKSIREHHPYRPGFDDSKGYDPYRQIGGSRVGSGIVPGTDPLCGHASCYA